MSNKLTLIISGLIIMSFFLAGLIDIIYELDILGNLVSRILLIGSFIGFIFYIINANTNTHKKNLPN